MSLFQGTNKRSGLSHAAGAGAILMVYNTQPHNNPKMRVRGGGGETSCIGRGQGEYYDLSNTMVYTTWYNKDRRKNLRNDVGTMCSIVKSAKSLGIYLHTPLQYSHKEKLSSYHIEGICNAHF